MVHGGVGGCRGHGQVLPISVCVYAGCVCERECLHSCMYIGVCMLVCLRESARAQVHAYRHMRVCEKEHIHRYMHIGMSVCV